MEDIITNKKDNKGKWLFVLFLVPAFFAIFFFVAVEQMVRSGKSITVPLVGGIICISLALIFGTISLVRFLRRRSIAGGLFLTTTLATFAYFLGSQLLTMGTRTNAMAPYNMSVAPYAAGGNAGWFSNVTLAHVGLFAIWFIFILFTIYIYVRPIRKIEYLLTQILAGEEIKKMKVGGSVQYKTIEDKLRALAETQHRRETQRQARLAKSRERNKNQRELMAELITEKEKLPPAIPLDAKD